jgi:hypothetical protein
VKQILWCVAMLAVGDLALAQVGTTVRGGDAATAEKAQQYGDQAKSAVSSEPNKSINKAKAKVHKAKAHHHAKAAKDAAKDIPK